MKYLRGHGIITMQIYYPPSISFAASTFAISIDINELLVRRVVEN